MSTSFVKKINHILLKFKLASILDAHEIASKVEKTLILLTFSLWHLNWLYNTNERHPFGCLFRLVAMKRTDGV